MTDGQAVMLAASVGVATVMLAGAAWSWLGRYVSDRREHVAQLHAAALRRHPAGSSIPFDVRDALGLTTPREYANRRGVEVWGAER